MADTPSPRKDSHSKFGGTPVPDGSTYAPKTRGPHVDPDETAYDSNPAVDDFVLGSTEDQLTVISKGPPLAAHGAIPVANTTELGRLLEGSDLGHFHLEEFVGGGGMGAVFRATDTMLNRVVAVKVLSRDHTDDEITRRFQNEAQSAARLDHDNIARVYYVGEQDGMHYIVFEFIEGVNVRDLIVHRGPLPADEAISYIYQVTEALAHADERDVVHRDIKPSNILVTEDGRAKLVDMGLARLHHMQSGADDLTQSGVTLGTFDYISPEQARDPRLADVRSDIYSLGCTFYYMLTGSPPFPEGTVLQKLLSHSSEAPEDPRLQRPDLSEAVCELLFRMLAKQPQDRQQTPGELANEIVGVAVSLGMRTNGRAVAMPVQRQPRVSSRTFRQLSWVVPIVCLMIFGLVSGILSSGDSFDIAAQSNALPQNLTPAPDPPATSAIESDAADESGQPTASATDDSSSAADAVDTNAGDSDASNSGSSENGNGTGDVGTAGDASADNDQAGAGTATDSEAGKTSPTESSDDGSMPQTPSEQLASAANSANGTADGPIANASGDDASETDNSNADDASVAPVIVVGALEQESEVGRHYVSSLSEAIKLAPEIKDLDAIELHYDGPRLSGPIRLDGTDLTIRAGQGFQPVVHFSQADLPRVSSYTKYVEIRRGSLTWEGVHIFAEVEEDSVELLLFQVDRAERIELRDCFVTIRNYELNADQAAVFSLAQPELLESELDSDETVVSSRPMIQIQRSVIRGQVTLCQAKQMTPCVLSWEEGMFISDGRLLEFTGAMSKHDLQLRGIEVQLRNITCIAGRGIARVSLSGAGPHPSLLFVFSHHCVFQVDPSLVDTLYEVQGVAAVNDVHRWLTVRGNDNMYFDSKNVISIAANQNGYNANGFGPAEPAKFDFAALKSTSDWYLDMNSEAGEWMRWAVDKTNRAKLTVDKLLPTDYDGADANLRERLFGAGCDQTQLPKIPMANDPKDSTPERTTTDVAE